jgi:thiol-disulfide isomerase/thioredoxin
VTQDNESRKQANGKQVEKGVLRVDQNELMAKGFSFSGYERDPLYLNLGTKKFLDISGVSGIDSITDGRAGVFADFDNDGDLDVFMTTIQGKSHLLFRNNVGQESNYLRVTLEGAACGRDAFGAVVRVKTGAGIETKIKAGGSGFLSQHDGRLLFGLGKEQRAEWLEVTWPNGNKQRFENVPANSSIRLAEGAAKLETVKESRAKLPDPLTPEDLLLKTLRLRRGEPFPAMDVTTFDGQSAPLASALGQGTKTLVNIWATWCAPCAKEMPELERLQPRLKAAGVKLVGLSIDADGVAPVKEFVTQRGFTYPNVVGGEKAMEQIYATDEATVPISVLLDEKGRVLEVFGGWSRRTAEALERLTRK